MSMKPELDFLLPTQWSRYVSIAALTGVLCLQANAVNAPTTTTPPNKNNGTEQETSNEEEKPSSEEGSDCDGSGGANDSSTQCGGAGNGNGSGDLCPKPKPKPGPTPSPSPGPTTSPTPSPNPTPNCIHEEIALALAPNEPGLGAGIIKLYIDATGPNLGSREHLEFFGMSQMAITEVKPEGNDTLYTIVQAKSTAMQFRLSPNAGAIGVPVGASAYSQARLQYVDAAGNATGKANAAYVRHYRSSDGFCDYPVNGGAIKRYITRQGRVYDFPLVDVEVIRERTDGTKVTNGPFGDGQIRQVKTIGGLIDVVVLSDRSYRVDKYGPQQIGAKNNGVFAVTGEPTTSMTVSAPAGTQNEVVVSKKSGSLVTTNSYKVTLNGETETWTQHVESGAFKYVRTLSRGPQAELGPDYRRTTRACSLTDAPGLAANPNYTLEADTYKYAPVSSKETFSDGYVANRTLELATPSWDPNGVGRPAGRTNSLGGGWSATYDAASAQMLSKTTSMAQPGGGGGHAPQARVLTYAYQPHAAGEQLLPGDFRPRTTTTQLDGVTIGQEFFSARFVNGAYTEVTERTTAATGSFGGNGNLRSERKWYASGANQGRLEQSLDFDGNLTRFEYADKPDHGLEVTKYVTLAGSGTALSGYSARTRELRDCRGWPLEVTPAQFVNGAWVDYETITSTFNAAGRLLTQSHRDLLSNQVRTLLTQEWDGDLLTKSTDEHGIVTRYEYFAGSNIVRTHTREAIPASGAFAAQPAVVTTYSGTFTVNGSQMPEWAQRTTTVSAGALALTEVDIFDHHQRVVSHTDANGYGTTTAYGSDDKLITTTLPSGATRITAQDSEGRVLSVTGTAEVSAFYHESGLASGGLSTTVYQGADNGPRYQTTEKDFAGRVSREIVPAFGGGTAVTTYTYSATHPKACVRVSRTGQPNKLCVPNLVGVCDRQGLSADDDQLDLASATDRITDTLKTTEQDSNGLWAVTKNIIYPTAGSAESKIASISRRKLAGFAANEISRSESTDILGNTTVSTTTCNGLLDESRTSVPGVSIDTVNVSYAKRLQQSTSPTLGGGTVTFGYDALGREVSRKNPRHQNASIITYGENSNLIAAQTDAAGNTTSFSYYPQGVAGADKVKSTTLADGSVKYAAYTQRGELAAEWGSQTYPVYKAYSLYGELVELRTFRNLDASSLHTANLDLASQPGYDATAWNYDAATGLLANKRYADGKGPDYQYDAAGRMTQRLWARANRFAPNSRLATHYAYNGFGQLTGIDYTDEYDTPDVTQTYDRLGRMLLQSNGVAQSIFAYDPATLRVDTETISYNLDGQPGFEFSRVLDRTNDNLARDTGFALEDGTNVENQATYEYETATGRMASVSGGGFQPPSLFSYTYAPNSSLLTSVTGPAHTVTNTWEANCDVLDVKENKAGETLISRFDYGVNSIGQRTSRSTTGSAATEDVAWSYDSLGQVIAADSTSASLDRVYQYDSIGNRKKSADSLTLPSSDNYTANALNQYSATQTNPQSAVANPQYDLDGNMVSRSATQYTEFSWDSENRLIESNINSVGASRRYDSQSRLISKYDHSQSLQTIYLYDGWNCVAEYHKSFNGPIVLNSAYTWGLDLSGSLQGAGGVGGLLSVTRSSSPSALSYFPAYDGNGNVSEYLDANGAVVAHYEYDAFGRDVVANDSIGFAYKFSTKPHDVSADLYYYGYRFYNSLDGRWISRDSILEEGGFNLYGFLNNNSVDGVDYLGMMDSVRTNPMLPELVKAGVAGAAGAIATNVLGGTCTNKDGFSYGNDKPVDCTRTCSRRSFFSMPCSDTKGKGTRKATYICRGWVSKTWEFYKWEGEASDCDAASCSDCCNDGGFKYDNGKP